MTIPTNIQIMEDEAGNPAFVLIPYAHYKELVRYDQGLIPEIVSEKISKENLPPIRAWREYLGLTPAEVAKRLNVAISMYNRVEKSTYLKNSSLVKISSALGIELNVLKRSFPIRPV